MDQLDTRDQLLLAIDRGLDRFGSNVRVVVYFEMQKLFGISREQIPMKPDLLVATIDKLFGVGARSVSHAIIKELEASSGIKDLSKKDLLSAIRTVKHVQQSN